ncbi:helix-turn-helix transcriptional regulator [Methanohalophilus levihalophilus]|uniref:helix-turn-helix transcriptional regulator n=1 Tax=Methanohalophilus levihalophilus TaxID=1431282 RepID=UPI001AE109F5|nr:winged helix-turn-helix domain-containing protein [Methanohalophilus levihalophilus]
MIDTIFLSEKRENFLLMLLEGEADMEKIREDLDVTSSSMLPQIKKLREEGLVNKDDNGVYSLTTIGRLIVNNMVDLSLLFRVFDKNLPYWYNRDLSSIPAHLLDRIGELGDISFIEPDLDHMYELQETFVESLQASSQIKAVVPFFHPMQIDLYADLAESGNSIDLLLTESVYSRIRDEYTEKFSILNSSDNVSIAICQDCINPVSMNVGNNFAYISLLNSSGRYDHRDVCSYDKNAIIWATELFDYYFAVKEISGMD